MTLQGQCRECDNVEIEMRLQGTQYREQRVCIYDRASYPRAQQCDKFAPRAPMDED